MYGDGVRQAKVKLELNMANNINSNKGFYRYVNQKKKVIEGKLATINNDGKLVTMGEEKAEVLKDFCLCLQWQPLLPLA